MITQVFTANTDRYSVVKNYLLKPLSAKSVRVLPLTWNIKICMRLELYGCPYVSGALLLYYTNVQLEWSHLLYIFIYIYIYLFVNYMF